LADHRFQGRRILVVEDEYFLATELELELGEAGAVVVGPAPSVGQALALIGPDPALDCALLDINLGGEMVFPVADRLMAHGVPFVFATGYTARDIPDRYAGVPRITKPAEPQAFARALTEILKV
jgi:CheY-like chemotaxis protein